MSNNESNEQPLPMDDWGIQNDKIIDIAEYVINKLHEQIVDEHIQHSVDELVSIINATHATWSLVQDVLELEDHLRRQIELYDGDDDDDDDSGDDELIDEIFDGI